MTPDDDPFGLRDNSDLTRTVIARPQPGGRRAQTAPFSASSAPGAAFAEPAPAAAGTPLAMADVAGRSPIVAAAAPLLSLAPRLKVPDPPAQPDALRERVLAEIARFRQDAAARGVESRTVEQAAWALAALIDDIVLDTPWGRQSSWPRRSLVATLWGEVDAGEKFFERLAALQREPGRHRDVLLVAYLCLAMGFEGRYRVAPRAGVPLAEIKAGLARLLGDLAGPVEPGLSPHWQGVKPSARPPSAVVPPWLVGVVALALLLLLWTGFRYRLADYTAEAASMIERLPPRGPVTVRHDRAQAPPVNLPVTNPVRPRLDRFLAPEIAARLVTVEENAQRVLVRLTAEDLFASGRADLNPRHLGLIRRIGEALEGEPGAVRVVGHTDNQPIKRSPLFATNQELSEARAAAVAAILRRQLTASNRVTSEGKAERDPIAANDTPAGRSANRRVEILLFRRS